MNANNIEAGKTYIITVGKNTTTVKVMNVERRVNGTLVFQCENVKTGKPMTIADAKRFVKVVKDDAQANPIGDLGFGAGSIQAQDDAERRERIAQTPVEAGAEPEHVEAAQVAMAAQAAANIKPITSYSAGDQITLPQTALWTNNTGNGPERHEWPAGTTLTLTTRKPEGWECTTEDGSFFFLFDSYLQSTDAKGKGGKKKGTLSGLDAAARVLADATAPMRVKEITERAIELGWAPEGKTPMNTLSAAIQMEVKRKGDASRFAKADKGLYVRK